MKCPKCGYPDSKVIDSRPNDSATCIKRRRECIECQYRFTTYETYEITDSAPLVVVKKDSSLEIFDKNKIKNGLIRACYKRPVSNAQINEIADGIETELKGSVRNEFNSSEIGTMVMERLKLIDEVSYVRFASVYREFKDVDTFMKELNDLKLLKMSEQ